MHLKRYTKDNRIVQHSECPKQRTVTPLVIFKIVLCGGIFPGGDCFCLGYLLSGKSLTNTAYAESMKIVSCILLCAESITKSLELVCGKYHAGLLFMNQ